jgi:hypothetical protein
MTSSKNDCGSNASKDVALGSHTHHPPRKSRAFYLTFAAIMVATILSALDLTAVGTALPTVAKALNDTKGDFPWVWNCG